MKVKMFDKILLRNVVGPWVGVVGFISGIISFFNVTAKDRLYIIVVLCIMLIAAYIYFLVKSNRLKKIILNHDGSTIEIKEGNILSKEYKRKNIIRVFNFNEFFDTEISRELVSEKTLNGQILNEEFKHKIEALDSKIEADEHLRRNIAEQDMQRIKGKTTRYQLGTIFVADNNTFFTALTHFDEENKARLLMTDYIEFLMKFWNEIDTLYDGNTVVITLFGNGRTRLDNGTKYEPQELLKIILWTFKLRKLKFEMPDRLVILLDGKTNSQIDYFHLKEDFNGL
ncbi:DUF6430 domain-containing protein [Lactobacillaceae bacterium KNUT 0156]|nr:DUF6430 domain-containing protein [Weissella cibaria]